MLNWYFGWSLILAAFVVGAILGLFFYREDFLGGYASFRRRLLRLGHVALAALGMLNVLFSLTPGTSAPAHRSRGSVFCHWRRRDARGLFPRHWRIGFRHLFFVPVVALVIAVIQTLRMGLP